MLVLIIIMEKKYQQVTSSHDSLIIWKLCEPTLSDLISEKLMEEIVVISCSLFLYLSLYFFYNLKKNVGALNVLYLSYQKSGITLEVF